MTRIELRVTWMILFAAVLSIVFINRPKKYAKLIAKKISKVTLVRCKKRVVSISLGMKRINNSSLEIARQDHVEILKMMNI